MVVTAFGEPQGEEVADLVSGLLEDKSARPLWSLVATVDGAIAGHILFTAARIEVTHCGVSSAILAPLAVHPAYRNQGIGGQLISKGLEKLERDGVDLVFVLGYPDYYRRYGFHPAGVEGFDPPYPIPPEHADAWMVQQLRQEVIGDVRGRVICADTLNAPEHWRE